jgi:hypothetical protein
MEVAEESKVQEKPGNTRILFLSLVVRGAWIHTSHCACKRAYSALI